MNAPARPVPDARLILQLLPTAARRRQTGDIAENDDIFRWARCEGAPGAIEWEEFQTTEIQEAALMQESVRD